MQRGFALADYIFQRAGEVPLCGRCRCGRPLEIGDGCLPCGLGYALRRSGVAGETGIGVARGGGNFFHLAFERGYLLPDILQLGPHLFCRNAHYGRHRLAMETGNAAGTLLFHGIEEGGHLVELAVGNGVVFVSVALGAIQGQPQPDAAHGDGAVGSVGNEKFRGVRAALLIEAGVAVEARGDLLLDTGVRQQVSGQLPFRELVERHVAVISIHHPVAPKPGGPVGVIVIAVGIAVARQIKPCHGHAFAEARTLQHAVHHAAERAFRGIVSECIDLRQRRRHAAHIQRHAADQSQPVRLRRWRHVASFQRPEYETVDRLLVPSRIADRGRWRMLRMQKRPMLLVNGTLRDPLLQQGLFLRVEGFMGFRRRHLGIQSWIVDTLHQFAFLGLSRNDGDRPTLGRCRCLVAQIQPKVTLERLGIRAVTGVTFV